MSKDDNRIHLETILQKLGFESIILEVGDHVYCDLCNKDYKDSDEKGGFLFGSHAICPECAPGYEKSARGYGESHYIRARPHSDESFRDFVYRIRKSGE